MNSKHNNHKNRRKGRKSEQKDFEKTGKNQSHQVKRKSPNSSEAPSSSSYKPLRLFDGFKDPIQVLSRWKTLPLFELAEQLSASYELFDRYLDWGTSDLGTASSMCEHLLEIFGRSEFLNLCQDHIVNQVLEKLWSSKFIQDIGPKNTDTIGVAMKYILNTSLCHRNAFLEILKHTLIKFTELVVDSRKVMLVLINDVFAGCDDKLWMSIYETYQFAYTKKCDTGEVPVLAAKTKKAKPNRVPLLAPRYEFKEDPPLDDIIISRNSYPEDAEMTQLEPLPIRTNPILNGDRFVSMEHYLDTTWRLLRSDCIEPLKKSIFELRTEYKKFQEQRQVQRGPEQPPSFSWPRLTDCYSYEQVKLDSVGLKDVAGGTNTLLYVFSFQIPGNRQVRDWKLSKRLISGSLVGLTSDGFRSFIWATVASRDPKLLERNRVALKIPFQYVTDILQQKPFMMIESRALWTSYQPVLDRLHSFYKETSLIPLPDQLIFDDFENNIQTMNRRPVLQSVAKEPTNINAPLLARYLKNTDEAIVRKMGVQDALDAESVMKTAHPQSFTFLDFAQWKAFKMMMTQQVSLVQGPPGTGKTFIGLKVVEELLKQRGSPPAANLAYIQATPQTDEVPILCICYTNHALDQFLEGVLKFETNIVRLGSRSKSDILQPYLLINQMKSRRRSGSYGKWTRLREEARAEAIKQFRAISQPYTLLPEFVEEYEIPLADDHDNVFGFLLSVLCWLGVEAIKVPRKAAPSNAPPSSSNSTPQISVPGPAPLEEEVESSDEDELEEAEDLDWDLESTSDSSSEQVPYSPAFDQHVAQAFQEKLYELIGADFTMNKQDLTSLKTQWLEMNGSWSRFALIFYHIQSEPHYSKLQKEKARLLKEWLNQQKELTLSSITAFETNSSKLKKYQDSEAAQDLRSFKVIGMTTTFAALYSPVLNAIGSKIVIIEEAAEILEAHTMACLPSTLEKLILIGDHQQLRPKVVHYELTKRGLDISLFERLIKAGAPHVTLRQQHRMHPEISAFMRPIYPNLIDAPSTDSNRIDVSSFGFPNRTIFFEHNWQEAADNAMEGGDPSLSKCNYEEARFIFGMARYMVAQGIEPQDINIIAMYLGQRRTLSDMFKKQSPKGFPNHQFINQKMKQIRIACIDDYQGEESPIIIVSLVRSNPDGKLGFTSVSNRICVSLSRAKSAMFVVGSRRTLDIHCQYNKQKNCLWKPILKLMNEHKVIKSSIQLTCPMHPETIQTVQSATDWAKSLNMCTMTCNVQMECGHWCKSSCHGKGTPHPCLEKCARVFPCNHPCPKLCTESCGECEFRIPKYFPKCRHTVQVKCHEKDSASCTASCEKILACGHPCPKKCYQPCEKKCLVQLHDVKSPCGHTLQSAPCHLTTNPILLQRIPHLCGAQRVDGCIHPCDGDCSTCKQKGSHPKCKGKCGRNLPCNHACKSNCSEPCSPCKIQKCRNSCSHGSCKLHCSDHCIPCMDKCTWECPHKSCTKHCFDLCDREACNESCSKKLKCGHSCLGLCGEICPEICFVCDSDTNIFGSYFISAPLKDEEPTVKLIWMESCKHAVEVNAMDQYVRVESAENKSIQHFKCPLCTTPITKPFGRYSKELKQRRDAIDQIKFIYFKDAIKLKFKNGGWEKCKKMCQKALKVKRTGHQMCAPQKDIDVLVILASCEVKLGSDDNTIQKVLDDIRIIEPNHPSVQQLESKLLATQLPSLVAAMRGEIRSGGWYKCRNGHPFTIGECGGAMETAKCGCGAPIGGTNHTLLSDNSHADVDGSDFAAWSNQANLNNRP